MSLPSPRRGLESPRRQLESPRRQLESPKTIVQDALILDMLPVNFTNISGFLTDITLQSLEGKRYPAHKILLANASNYFMVLFTIKLKDPGSNVVLDVHSQILEFYLDLIYKRTAKITTWKDAIDLLKFLDYTETTIPKLEDIIHNIHVNNPEEYNDFFHTIIHEIYHGEVTLEFIQSINKFKPLIKYYLNYRDLGEEFTRTLIETQISGDEKYRIAVKAVSDGLDPSLYKMIHQGSINGDFDLTAKSWNLLRQFDYKLLSKFHDIGTNPSLIVGIRNPVEYDPDLGTLRFSVEMKDLHDLERLVYIVFDVRLNYDEKYTFYSATRRRNEILLDILTPGTVIKITNYTKKSNTREWGTWDTNLSVGDFEIVEY